MNLPIHRWVRSTLTLHFLLFIFYGLSATNCTWIGGSSNDWGDPANWDCGQVPGADANVTISVSSVMLNSAVSITQLNLTGSIFGSGSLTVLGLMNWGGSSSVDVPLSIPSPATLNVTSGGSKNFTGILTLPAITNHSSGTIVIGSDDIIEHTGNYALSGSGAISIATGGEFRNRSGATFDVNRDNMALTGSGSFLNEGTFTRSGGAGTLVINNQFQNTGTLNHIAGAVLDFNGAFTQDGTLTLNAGAELETNTCTVNTTFALAAGQTWDMNGTTTLNLAFVPGGSIDLNSNLGGTGSLTINNQMNWRGGNVSIPLSVSAGAMLDVSSSSTKNFAGALTLAGTTTHTGGAIVVDNGDMIEHTGKYALSGSGAFSIATGGEFRNRSGATFDVNRDNMALTGSGSFLNEGTFTRSGGAGTLVINNQFQNTGTLNHIAGTVLDFNGAFTQDGILTLNAGAELETNTCTVNTTFLLAAGQTWDVNGTTTLNLAFVPGGLIDLNSNLGGTGSLTIDNQMNWRGGNVSIPLSISAGATLNVSTSITKNFTGTLTLAGTTNHTGGAIVVDNGDIIEHTGNYALSSNGVISIAAGGEFRNLSGADFAVDRSGSVILGSGHFQNDGVFRSVDDANTISVGTDFELGGTLTGIGAFDFTATFIQNGTVDPGLSPGILTLDAIDNTNGILLIELAGNAGAGTEYDQLRTTGPAELGGILQIEFLNDLETNYEPQVGDQFTIMTCDPCTGAFAQIIHPGDNPAAWSVSINTTPNPDEVILELAQALPVRWHSFTATPAERHIDLHWQTSAERDNRGFTVQRSPDGRAWTDLGFVPGAGDSDGTTDYRYRDTAPLPGTSFYRLQQEDWDGTVDYSPIRTVRRKDTAERPLAGPNPFTDELWLHLPAGYRATHLQLYDAAGNLVLTRRLPVGTAESYRLRTAELPAGTYLIRLDTRSGTETIPVMKNR